MCNKKYAKIYKKYVIHYTDHVAECFFAACAVVRHV